MGLGIERAQPNTAPNSTGNKMTATGTFQAQEVKNCLFESHSDLLVLAEALVSVFIPAG